MLFLFEVMYVPLSRLCWIVLYKAQENLATHRTHPEFQQL